MADFRNNLQKDDRVIHTETKRPGVVASQPRESSRNVAIVWQGTSAQQYVDVMQLRLIVNGQPEDVALVDGEPPIEKERWVRSRLDAPAAPAHIASPLEHVRNERAKIKAEMDAMTFNFKALKLADDRLAEAEKALTAPQPPPS